MKTKKNLLHLAFILITAICYAGGEDVVYLKNGSVYRGVIIEEKPMQSYTIRIYGGTTFVLAVADVQRVSRERQTGPVEYIYDSIRNRRIRVHLKTHYFLYPDHGFFGQWQTVVGWTDGMRLYSGYRFNPYLAIGLGLGFEYGNTTNWTPYAASNGYLPMLLYMTGDILKSKWTPYYSIEAGYNLAMNKYLQTPDDDGIVIYPKSYFTSYGGVTSGAGFGVREYTRHHCSLMLSLNMNVGYLRIKTDGPYDPGNRTLIATTSTSNWLALQPTLRFGVSFY
jgi:hypothetical protein